MTVRCGEKLGAIARGDVRFLRGEGLYVDDMRLEVEIHGHVLRSPHAHARIRTVDREAALRAPGVCAILAADRVRHVGDGVAFVVAETRPQAIAAAERVAVGYEPLAAIIDPTREGPGVPIWPDAPDNVCFDWRFGDQDTCRRLFAAAAHVVRMTLGNPRIVVNAVEPRAAIGAFDPATGRFTLVANTQGSHFVRRILAKSFGVPATQLRVTIGTQSTGQDHATRMALHAARSLALDAACVTVCQGDSGALARGGGTDGSKSRLTSSVAIERAVVHVIARGRARCAAEWGAPEAEILFESGVFARPGSNETKSVVEIAADDDFGQVVNPPAVSGQIQGGIAQGIGQALMEQAAMDPASGQPRAADVPDVGWADNGLASPSNIFGAEACGKAGAAAAPPAIMNAIADALAAYCGAWDLQMPAHAAEIRRLIDAGG